jgi:environmental stress-induced protein Ves
MTLHLVHAGAVAPQAWKNRGGTTRELLAWPSSTDWVMRISVARIDHDGPFSLYPDVQRWFAVIDGAGIALGFVDGVRRLKPGDSPLCFDGASTVIGRLLDGPTHDLNLMLRRGQGAMRPVWPAIAWDESFEVRALYAAVGGRWSAGGERYDVPAQTLLWGRAASATPWRYQPDDARAAPIGWWLGYTPEGMLK